VKNPNTPMYIDKAPPARVIALITLLASTLDLFADVILAIYLGKELTKAPPFGCVGKRATYAYFFFTGITGLVYVVEFIDCVTTLKNNQETRWLSRLSKSLCLTCEEVPLPICLLIIFTTEPGHRGNMAGPVKFGAAIKFIALTWGIVKFIKLKFCWPFYPCNGGHGYHENVRRCFKFTLYRVAMIIVNICHVVSICLCVINMMIATGAGKPLSIKENPPCSY